jgi:SAM-dependent methyltransferase
MLPTVTDKTLLRRRLTRAVERAAPGVDFLLRRVVDDLAERLAGVERHFGLAIAHGGLDARLAAALSVTGKVGHVLRLEPLPACFTPGEVSGAVADEEALPLRPGSIDLFASALALQWTNDLPGALVQIRQALRPDGLFLAAMAGGRTLAELREALFAAETEIRGGASPRVLPATDVRDAGALLQRAGFALPVADAETIRVRYGSMFELMRDLRAMGETSVLAARPRRPAPLRLFTRAAEIYAERHAEPDGRISATFRIVWLSGWAPHSSQQKPLRPGSATARLADALAPGGTAGS